MARYPAAMLTPFDWAALALFALCWLGYATLVDRVPAVHARSVIAAMDEHRRRWMRAMLARDNRIADIAAIAQGNSPWPVTATERAVT